MKPSQVRLEHYHLTALSILPNDEYSPTPDDGLYPKFSDAVYQIGVRMSEPEENGIKRFLIHLDLNGKPKESHAFPYTFSICSDAIVVFHGEDTDSQHIRDLVLVNGVGMLYSALREVLLSLTGRFPNGPMMLPSTDFRDLRKSIKAKQPDDPLHAENP